MEHLITINVYIKPELDRDVQAMTVRSPSGDYFTTYIREGLDQGTQNGVLMHEVVHAIMQFLTTQPGTPPKHTVKVKRGLRRE